MASCANQPPPAGSAAGPPLTQTEWKLIEFQSSDDSIGTIRPVQDEVYTMTLKPDGSLVMQLSCNRGGGQWKSPDAQKSRGSIELIMGFSSLAACPPGKFDNLTQRLPDVRTFVIQDGRLNLNLKMDAGNYVWQPQ